MNFGELFNLLELHTKAKRAVEENQNQALAEGMEEGLADTEVANPVNGDVNVNGNPHAGLEDINTDVANPVNGDVNVNGDPHAGLEDIKGLLENLHTLVLQKLFTILRLIDRPTKKADYVSRLMEIPTNGVFNKNFKTAAKKIGIKGSDNAIKRQLIQQQRSDILYRILPHTATEWHARIESALEEHDLIPISEVEVIPLLINNQPQIQYAGNPSHIAANPKPTVETSVQTNIALTQCITLFDQIRNDIKSVNVILKHTHTLDLTAIDKVRHTINKVKEDIVILDKLQFECNAGMEENLAIVKRKMSKIETLYEARENKSRSDVLQYIRSVDNYSPDNLTKPERNIIERIVEKISSLVHCLVLIFRTM